MLKPNPIIEMAVRIHAISVLSAAITVRWTARSVRSSARTIPLLFSSVSTMVMRHFSNNSESRDSRPSERVGGKTPSACILRQLTKGRPFDLPLPTKTPRYAAFGDFFAASFSFSALMAGANCSITESRLNEAAFWRGGYFTKFSIWAATIACAP